MSTYLSTLWASGLWIALLLPCGEGMLPAPLNVSVLSYNLEHSLTWLPGVDTPAHAQFRVHSLHLRRNQWKSVKGCDRLSSRQTCSLTKAFKDPFGYYQARVQTFTPTHTSNWTLSSFFHPLTETVVGPPRVAVSGCGSCLLVKLTPPADRGGHLSFFYGDFTCQVQRTRDGSQFSLWVVSTQETVIDHLEPGAEYCLTAMASTAVNPHTVPSEPHCAFTSPPAPRNVPMFLGLLSMFSVLMALFMGGLVYTGHLLCWAKPLPKTLSSIPLIGRSSQQEQLPDVFSQVSLLTPGCSECRRVIAEQEPVQKTSLGEEEEEEEEDEGYGQVILSEETASVLDGLSMPG